MDKLENSKKMNSILQSYADKVKLGIPIVDLQSQMVNPVFDMETKEYVGVEAPLQIGIPKIWVDTSRNAVLGWNGGTEIYSAHLDSIYSQDLTEAYRDDFQFYIDDEKDISVAQFIEELGKLNPERLKPAIKALNEREKEKLESFQNIDYSYGTSAYVMPKPEIIEEKKPEIEDVELEDDFLFEDEFYEEYEEDLDEALDAIDEMSDRYVNRKHGREKDDI